MQLAVDTGGTFTDLIVKERDGTSRMFKSSTTPDDPVVGVLSVLALAAEFYESSLETFLSRADRLIHGTTHALNAVVTGNTARTALLVTEGHGDILVMREGGRGEAFNFKNGYPAPYIPRSLTFQIPERICADGRVVQALDEHAATQTLKHLAGAEIEAVAVCLLWSIVNPSHEHRMGELIEKVLPGVPYTLSADLNPAIREFRRASSAAIDASLKPLMGRYMSHLEDRLYAAGFRGRTLIVTSQAGVIDASRAANAPIHVLNSGPSMAPLAGGHFALVDEGADDAIVADTGGTTYDVSLVRSGNVPTTRETWIGPPFRGIMIGFPWVAVKSVGAGGGSIAWIDDGGLLHVGPQSAGADPGPVAYGRGGAKPTVTDASLVLGHLDPENFLGGAMALDRGAATRAIEEQVATPLGLDVEQAADAILALATENMVQAIIDITVNQGIDPQGAVLIGGGGAAGLNSVRIARSLGCPRLLIPECGATLSAAGATMSDLKAEYRSAYYTSTAGFDALAVQAVLDNLVQQCELFIKDAGKEVIASGITAKVEARYATQVWEIEVPLRKLSLLESLDLDQFVEDFHRSHKALYAFDDRSSPIEILGWCVEASCRFSDDNTLVLDRGRQHSTNRSCRQAYFKSTGWTEVDIFAFEGLRTDEIIDGPAIVESAYTTVVVDPGTSAVRRSSGSLSLKLGEQI